MFFEGCARIGEGDMACLLALRFRFGGSERCDDPRSCFGRMSRESDPSRGGWPERAGDRKLWEGSQQWESRESVSRVRRESEPELETMRILSGWGCNIPRADQIPNRRGGEKPRGRQQTGSTWWWRVLDESFGSRGWVGSGSTEAGRNLRERIFKRGRPERGSRSPTGNGGKNGSRSGGRQTARRGRRKVHEGCSSIVVTHDGGEHLVFP